MLDLAYNDSVGFWVEWTEDRSMVPAELHFSLIGNFKNIQNKKIYAFYNRKSHYNHALFSCGSLIIMNLNSKTYFYVGSMLASILRVKSYLDTHELVVIRRLR